MLVDGASATTFLDTPYPPVTDNGAVVRSYHPDDIDHVHYSYILFYECQLFVHRVVGEHQNNAVIFQCG